MFFDPQLQNTVEAELETGERLLWVGQPNPKRMLLQAIVPFGFGLVWTTFIVNFIVMWHSGPRQVQGPAGLFGMQGILSNFFFVPFIVIGVGMLCSPAWYYLKVRRTLYAITEKRVLIIEMRRSRKVKSYGAGDIGNIEKTVGPDGTGDLIFARRPYKDSDGNQHARTSSLWASLMSARWKNFFSKCS